MDGNKVSKRMASVDKIEIDGICMTFWCGLRPTSLKFTSGLGRRFSYQMYFPTWEEAKKFKQDLLADGFNAVLDESVHHSTLKAFVKEQIEQGVVLPELFTVFIGERAEITLPKKK